MTGPSVCLPSLQGLEALQAAGRVRSIGVSNFSVLQLERLLALCRVPPAVNQVLPEPAHVSRFHVLLPLYFPGRIRAVI